MGEPRIVWLLTESRFCWHPVLSEMTKLFPNLTVFAPNWPGYASGFENTFNVKAFSKPKVVPLRPSESGYGLNFTYLPLNMIGHLLRSKPDLVFSNSFGIWTLLALLFKFVGQWSVVIAYEGSSPCVDFRDSPLRLALRRWMVRVADAYISNSQAGKTYLIDILKAETNLVFAHPYQTVATQSLLGGNLVDQSIAQLPRPIFLFVGRIIPRKGLRQMLEACTLLQQRECHHYSLLIIGEGSQRLELEEFVSTHGLGDRVRWIGGVNYQNLGAYFCQSDVLLMPTLEDTWGMVVLEAMALGKPVLCSRWAGSAELVIKEKTGYCFDPNNPAELAQGMYRFISNPQLAIDMGQQAKQQMEHYTPEIAAQFLASVTSFVLQSDSETAPMNSFDPS